MSSWQAAVLGVSLMAAWPASAAVFGVNSMLDEIDAAPGDGVCASASGVCTLRAAVMETNALVGEDVVNVAAGMYQLGIPGREENGAATGDLDILDDLNLVGAGAEATIIDAAGIDRVLDVLGMGAASVASLTITGGLTSAGGDLAGGGGGIRCQACDRLLVSNSTISGNTAGGGGGIALNFVGGLSGGGSATIASTTISGNLAIQGGGVSAQLWTNEFTIRDSVISRNAATIAAYPGGGVYIYGIVEGVPPLLLLDSTVSENVGAGVSAEGCHPKNCGFGSAAHIQYSTISRNSLGGVVATYYAYTSLLASIIAEQISGPDCYQSPGLPPYIESLGHNLDSDGSCGLTQPTDLPNTDPLLGPLQDNGGLTWTHALLAGSPARDAIPTSECGVATDQRGVARPQWIGCDIGAFEAFVSAGCGLGPELAMLLPPLLWLRERRRRQAA